MRPRRITLLLLIVIAFINTAQASTSCTKTPDQACLLSFIKDNLHRLTESGVLISDNTLAHFQYETKHQQLNGEPFTTLQREDQFLALLNDDQTALAAELLPDIKSPMHDLNSADAEYLLIEHLTLRLKDAEADTIKRHYLEAEMKKSDSLDESLLAIALHESLGGAPHKSIKTLKNVPINEFSTVPTYHTHKNIEALIQQAQSLFLNPANAATHCNTPHNLTNTIYQFYSADSRTQLVSAWQTPHQIQAWKHHLNIARLYNNAGSCPLLVMLHIQHLIQISTQSSISSETDILNLIYLNRAINRYIKPNTL
jgi:hypothetical protein